MNCGQLAMLHVAMKLRQGGTPFNSMNDEFREEMYKLNAEIRQRAAQITEQTEQIAEREQNEENSTDLKGATDLKDCKDEEKTGTGLRRFAAFEISYQDTKGGMRDMFATADSEERLKEHVEELLRNGKMPDHVDIVDLTTGKGVCGSRPESPDRPLTWYVYDHENIEVLDDVLQKPTDNKPSPMEPMVKPIECWTMKETSGLSYKEVNLMHFKQEKPGAGVHMLNIEVRFGADGKVDRMVREPSVVLGCLFAGKEETLEGCGPDITREKFEENVEMCVEAFARGEKVTHMKY